MKLSIIRDTASLLSSAGIGVAGTAVKKLLVKEDDSMTKKVALGAAVTILTAGTGLLPYLFAAPGVERDEEVLEARRLKVDTW